jgi:hypothetical protein
MTLSKAGFSPHRSFSVASNTLFHLQDCLHRCMQIVLYHTCTYNRLLEDEPSGSKHVEDNITIKILAHKSPFCWFILNNYIKMHGAKT